MSKETKPTQGPNLIDLFREADPKRRKAEREQALANADRPTPVWYLERFEEDGGEAPAMPEAEVAVRPVARATQPEKVRRRWPATWIVVLGCIGFMLAVALLGVIVMLGRARDPAGAVTPKPSATVAPSVTVVPSETKTPTATAVPMSTATAVPSTSKVPSVTATAVRPSSRPLKPLAPQVPKAEPPPKDVTAPSAPTSTAGTQDPGLNE